jgi:hypothetical protein
MPDIEWHVNEDNHQETIVTTSKPKHRWRMFGIVVASTFGIALSLLYRSIPEPTQPLPITPAPTILTTTPTLTPTPVSITKTPTPRPTPEKIVIPTRAAAKTGTELRLNLKNSAGQPISVTSASLIWYLWGGGRGIALETRGNQIILPLDEEWLKSQLDFITYISWDFLLIKADGYVPLRSKDFTWIGFNGKQNRADIEFPNGPYIIVPEGEKREVDLIIRKPKPRYLRLIDDSGKPVSGVKVTSGVFDSDANHCGALWASFTQTSTSDSKGRAQIVDGDFEYALIFEKPTYVLKENNPDEASPQRFITYITSTETIVQLHQMISRTLDLHITQNRKIVSRLSVYGEGRLTGEGGCLSGSLLGKTDSSGNIHLSEFYPEMWWRIYVTDETGSSFDKTSITDEQGLAHYSDDPNKWPKFGTIEIDVTR